MPVPVPPFGRHSSPQSRTSPSLRLGLQSPVPAAGRRTGGQTQSPAALGVAWPSTHHRTRPIAAASLPSPRPPSRAAHSASACTTPTGSFLRLEPARSRSRPRAAAIAASGRSSRRRSDGSSRCRLAQPRATPAEALGGSGRSRGGERLNRRCKPFVYTSLSTTRRKSGSQNRMLLLLFPNSRRTERGARGAGRGARAI